MFTVSRMEGYRLREQLFYAELSTGQRHVGGQRKRYKDMLKATLKAYDIPVYKWQALAQDRSTSRATSWKSTQLFEEDRLRNLDTKRRAWKNRDALDFSTAAPCQLCGKICASTFGLQAHMCKHGHWWSHLQLWRTTTTIQMSLWSSREWWLCLKMRQFISSLVSPMIYLWHRRRSHGFATILWRARIRWHLYGWSICQRELCITAINTPLHHKVSSCHHVCAGVMFVFNRDLTLGMMVRHSLHLVLIKLMLRHTWKKTQK